MPKWLRSRLAIEKDERILLPKLKIRDSHHKNPRAAW